MIPLTTLYNEYIDRPKFSEQKNPFEYIVPPSPQKRGWQQKREKTKKQLKTILIFKRRITKLTTIF